MNDEELRRLVAERAGGICEYCRLPQSTSPFARFHVEHIIARQHGGATELTNLAFACGACNAHKGANIAGLDPDTGQLVALFNPRRDSWSDHFICRAATIIGKTPTGRVTALLLAMNDRARIEIREDLKALGEPFCD